MSRVRNKKQHKESRRDGEDMAMMAEGDVVREEDESTKVLFCTPYSSPDCRCLEYLCC